jgi:hypothetical protein
LNLNRVMPAEGSGGPTSVPHFFREWEKKK